MKTLRDAWAKFLLGSKSLLYLDKDFSLRLVFALQPSLAGLQPGVVQDFSRDGQQ